MYVGRGIIILRVSCWGFIKGKFSVTEDVETFFIFGRWFFWRFEFVFVGRVVSFFCFWFEARVFFGKKVSLFVFGL